MAKGSAIKQIRCPHCMNDLAVEGNSGKVYCPYCGEPVEYDFSNQESQQTKNVSYVDNSTGIMIGSGNKDPQSVIIFLEDYLEKHQDTVRKMYNEVGVSQIKKLVDEIKLSHGGEKDTWKLDFLSVYLPAKLRLDSIKESQKEMVEIIKEGGSRSKAFSKFYVVVEGMKNSQDNRERVNFELTRALNRYKQFGASQSEIKDLETKQAELEKLFDELSKIPENIYDIKEAKKALEIEDEKIAAMLREKMIDAEGKYEEAASYEQRGELTKALYNYSILEGYKDSEHKAEILNNEVRFKDLIVTGGEASLIRDHVSDIQKALNKRELRKAVKQEQKEAKTDEKSRQGVIGGDIVKIVNGEPSEEVAVDDFRSYLTTFGSLFYYISRKGTIHSYDFKTGQDYELEANAKHHEDILAFTYNNGTKGLILSDTKELIGDAAKAEKDRRKRAKRGDFAPEAANMFRLDILNLGSEVNFFEPLIKDIAKVEKFSDGAFLSGGYLSVIRNTYDQRQLESREKRVFETKHRLLVNIKTKKVYEDVIGINDVYVAIINDVVYYTKYSPTCYNIKLMKKDLRSGEEKEILDNIYNVVEVEQNKIFYVVGNTKKQSLFVLDLNKGEPKQVFERYVGFHSHKDGYFYLYRGSGFNKTLFKVSEDGEESYVLARHMKEDGYSHFSNNGYFYYENINDELLRVRLDGTDETLIAKNLEQVLKIDNKYVYFSCTETVDAMYSGLSGKKYLQGFSIYRYNSETKSSEKIIFNLFDWHYEGLTNELYAIRRSEESYRSTNMKRGRNFDYNTTVEKYVVINLDSLEEKVVLTKGLPHAEKAKGCFLLRLFTRHRDRTVTFERKEWNRPYLRKREEML